MTYSATLEREWRDCKIAVGGDCSSQRAIFHLIFGKFNYIFLIKNIELLKWHKQKHC